MDGSDDGRSTGNFGAEMVGTRRHERAVKLKQWLGEHRWSLTFVWLPSIVSAIYYFFIASNLYASEARFIVRTPSRMQSIGLSSLLQGTGISRAQDDVFSVQDFVMSRDALLKLQEKIDLRKIFGRPEADLMARYPNVLDHSSVEDFFRYYKRRVTVTYDTTTGISTILVKAFRPEDAQMIANELLKESEMLVNRLNVRAHENAVRDADTDVHLAEDRVAQAQHDVLEYRTRESLLDPNKSSGALFDTLSKMQAELTAERTRIAELERTSPDSPIRSTLEANMTVLEAQIDSQRAKLAGGGNSMAPKISEYDRLMLRQDFASRELASALASLEAARAEARRQNIYLDRVVEPNSPDKAEFPKRIRTVLTIFLCCFMAYSIVRLLISGVREHTQN